MRTCVLQSPEFSCIFCGCIGVFNLEGLKHKFNVMGDLEAYQAGAPVLCDMSGVDFTQTSGVEMLSAGRVRAAPLSQPTTVRKISLVAGSDLAFGQLSVIAQMRSTVTHSVQVFRTMPEALAWLKIPGLTDADLPRFFDRIHDQLHSAEQSAAYQAVTVLDEDQDVKA